MKNELLAPNGKPTNLTAEQYKLVRTDAFKRWFGNWEKDPENASKVIDENGEPLVCHHGTQNNKFAIFDRSKINSKTKTDTSNIGFWFTSSLWEAEGFAYGFDESERVEGVGRVISAFLNIKKPLNVIDFKKQIKAKFNTKEDIAGMYIEEHQLKIKEIFDSNDFDGILLENIFIIQKSNQVKLADGTNTTFVPSIDDIRFERGGETVSGIPDYLQMFLGK